MPAGRCLGWRTAVGSDFLFTHRFPIAGGGRAGRAPAHAGAQYHTCAAGCRLAQAALFYFDALAAHRLGNLPGQLRKLRAPGRVGATEF